MVFSTVPCLFRPLSFKEHVDFTGMQEREMRIDVGASLES